MYDWPKLSELRKLESEEAVKRKLDSYRKPDYLEMLIDLEYKLGCSDWGINFSSILKNKIAREIRLEKLLKALGLGWWIDRPLLCDYSHILISHWSEVEVDHKNFLDFEYPFDETGKLTEQALNLRITQANRGW